MKQERNLCDICKEVLEVGKRNSEVEVKICGEAVLIYEQICSSCAKVINEFIEAYKRRFSRKN